MKALLLCDWFHVGGPDWMPDHRHPPRTVRLNPL